MQGVLWGGESLASQSSRTSLHVARHSLASQPAHELIRLLTAIAHLRRPTYEEAKEDLTAILDYCANSQAANCTEWVRALAAILQQSGNNGSGLSSDKDEPREDALRSTDELVDALLLKMTAQENHTALTSPTLRRFQPHEGAYLDPSVLPSALRLPAANTSLAASKIATAPSSVASSLAQLNPHCSVRGAISFDMIIPKEEVAAAPVLLTTLHSTATSSATATARAAALAPKPLPSSSLFASSVRPLGRAAGAPSATAALAASAVSRFEKRGVIQMLDLSEAQSAMDTKRRKTTSTTAHAAAEETRRLKEEKERERVEAKEAKVREKADREAEKKAAAEAKLKDKEDKAAAKLEKAATKEKAKEEEKERVREEKERAREEKERLKEEKEREREEKKRLAHMNQRRSVPPPHQPALQSSSSMDAITVAAVIPATAPPPLPPQLMQMLVNAPQDPQTVAMFAQWHAQQQAQQSQQPQHMQMQQQQPQPQQFFSFPPPPPNPSFPFPMPGMPGMMPGMPGMMPGGMGMGRLVGMATVASAQPALARAVAPTMPMPVAMSALSEFPPPPPLPVDMDTTGGQGAAAATTAALAPTATAAAFPASQPSAPAPVATRVSAFSPPGLGPVPVPAPIAALAAPPTLESPALPPAPAPAPVVAGLDTVLAKSNKVSPEERDMITQFLNHQQFPHPAGTVNGVFQIVLNEESVLDPKSGATVKETSIFEMKFEDWSWRKFKKKLKSKAKPTTAATTPQAGALPAPAIVPPPATADAAPLPPPAPPAAQPAVEATAMVD